MNKEYKSLQFELKECGEPDEQFGYFEGYGSTFGNKDRVDDIIKAGAFDKTIKSGRRFNLLWQHNQGELIGSFPEVKVDSKGLFVKGRLNLGTQKGREGYALIKAGDLDSMSIGFRIPKGGSEYKDDIRYIKEIDLFEISLVTTPANTLATIDSVKSLENMKDINDFLQEKGFSNNERNILISKIKSVCKIEKEENAEDELKKQILQDLKNCL